MTILHRRRESVERLREEETADIDAHDEDEKRLAREAVGSGYFYTPTQQITELEPRVVGLKYIDWNGTEIQQSVLLRRYQVKDVVYIEHPGFLTGKRIKIKTLEHERQLGAWRRNGQKVGGRK